MTRPWSEQEVHRLKVLAKKHVSADEIAKSLDRHVGSVKRKAHELSLILFKKVETK
jgi:IS30 family transposase